MTLKTIDEVCEDCGHRRICINYKQTKLLRFESGNVWLGIISCENYMEEE